MKNRAPNRTRPLNTVQDSVAQPRTLKPITPADLERTTWDGLPGVPDSPSGTAEPLGLEPEKRVRR